MGFRLAAARAQSGLTQAEVAKRLGTTIMKYRKIEKDMISPTYEQANAMAEIFSIPVENLIFLGHSPEKQY